jgi:hypothetical protein
MDGELSRQIEYTSETGFVALFDFVEQMSTQILTLLALYSCQTHQDLSFCFLYTVFSSRGIHSEQQR